MEGGKSGQRRKFFLLKEQDLCWEEVLRGGPSLSILGLYIYFDEHLICCNLSVLLQGWHVQFHRLHTAQHQELCGINLGDRSSNSTLGFFLEARVTHWRIGFVGFFFFLTLEVKWNMEWRVIKQNLLYLRQLRTLRFYADFKYFTRLVFIFFWLNCGRRMEWGLAFSVSIK